MTQVNISHIKCYYVNNKNEFKVDIVDLGAFNIAECTFHRKGRRIKRDCVGFLQQKIKFMELFNGFRSNVLWCEGYLFTDDISDPEDRKVLDEKLKYIFSDIKSRFREWLNRPNPVFTEFAKRCRGEIN